MNRTGKPIVTRVNLTIKVNVKLMKWDKKIVLLLADYSKLSQREISEKLKTKEVRICESIKHLEKIKVLMRERSHEGNEKLCHLIDDIKVCNLLSFLLLKSEYSFEWLSSPFVQKYITSDFVEKFIEKKYSGGESIKFNMIKKDRDYIIQILKKSPSALHKFLFDRDWPSPFEKRRDKWIEQYKVMFRDLYRQDYNILTSKNKSYLRLDNESKVNSLIP